MKASAPERVVRKPIRATCFLRSGSLKVYLQPMRSSRPTELTAKPSTLPRTILFSLVLLFVGLAGFAFEAVERKSSETASDLLESRLQAIRHAIVLWSDDEQLSAESWAMAPGLPRIAQAIAAGGADG